MPKKSIPIALALFLNLALFAESVSFTKPSQLKVMTKSYDAEISYVITPATSEDTIFVTVCAFSYGKKAMGDFTFAAQKQKDGTYSAKKQVVPCERDGNTIDVTVSSAKISPAAQKVEVKCKPGKMPFAITLSTKPM